jgi:hypothetical protein
MFINENWYDSKEINEFLKIHENHILNESASIQTRIKLARAARRTAKRRSFVRKLRQKKRKPTVTLKKRAYNEVHSAFRQKLYKGSWSKLPYSARQRIDAMIQKRKPILDRIVKRIMPSVTKGETTRLQNLNKKKQ